MPSTPPAPRVILGIDPGSQITGVGVIEVLGQRLKYRHAASIKLGSAELNTRLKTLYRELNSVIETHKPDLVAVERVFIAKNPHSALVLGHARGAAILAAVNADVDIVEYSATEIKKTVVGRGRADKTQVQHMMRILLGLRAAPEADAADALAAAVCHAHHMQAQRLVKQV